jgi:hypothetical protein
MARCCCDVHCCAEATCNISSKVAKAVAAVGQCTSVVLAVLIAASLLMQLLRAQADAPRLSPSRAAEALLLLGAHVVMPLFLTGTRLAAEWTARAELLHH